MRRAALVIVAVAIVCATYTAGCTLGMTTRITTRHTFYSIPSAISRLQFATPGYVILGDVAEFFMTQHPHVTDATLQQSLALEPRRDRLMLFPADDKGGADFVTLAFRLFGFTLPALYDTWFAIFVVAIGVFVLTFRRQPARLAALCVLLLAIHAGIFALPLTTELYSIHNPRSFGIVSLVPLLHLAFAMIDRQRASPAGIAAAAIQAGIVTFSIHVRSTEAWQVIAVLGVAAAVYVRGTRGIAGIRRLWPAAVLIAAVGALEIYQRAAFETVYATTHIRHRIFWHNVGIGFALNPVLAEKYALTVDDFPMIQLVRRHLVETGRAAEIDELFRPAGQEQYHYYGITKDFVHYERVAREIVLSIVWNNPGLALKTFVVDKPRVLMRQFAWAAGYGGYSPNDLYLTGQALALATPSTRAANGIYLAPFGPWASVALLAVVLLAAGTAGDYRRLAAVAAGIAAASLLPALVAYPIVSALAVAMASVPFFLLSVVALLLQEVWGRLAPSAAVGRETAMPLAGRPS